MKKVILAIIVVIIVFAFTSPLYAWPAKGVPATGDMTPNSADPQVELGTNAVAYYSSQCIKNGGDFGGTGVDPSHGVRAAEIQLLLGHI